MTVIHAVHGRTFRASALVLSAMLVFAAVAVGVGNGPKAQAQEPATPVCPQGATFNAGTGQCETPTICPPGSTAANGTCRTELSCPPGDTSISAGALDESSIVCQPSGQIVSCPSGQTVSSVDVPNGVRIVCEGPPNACPPGFTPARPDVCTAPPTFTCAPDFILSGSTCLPAATTTTAQACPSGAVLADLPLRGVTCLPLGGTAGDVDASGGDAGSVRGGDGGRGGSGTLPVCNQNTNDSSWEELVQEVDEEGHVVDEYIVVHDAEPSLDCEAGGRGGSGGDAGIAEAGDGGLAFSVG